MMPSNPEIQRLRKLILRHQKKICKLIDDCNHDKVYVKYESGWDYEYNVYECSKCGKSFQVYL